MAVHVGLRWVDNSDNLYKKSIDAKMNDLDLCLEVVSQVMSAIALLSTLNVLQIDAIGNGIWGVK